jgi:hypothetical protein
MSPIRRNTGDDCEGNARCNFTCPAGAKRSVDVAYLPSALAHGARVVSDALGRVASSSRTAAPRVCAAACSAASEAPPRIASGSRRRW